MRDAILKVLVNSERALSVYELCDALNINTVEETKQLNEELRKLEEDATIYHSNKNKYLTLEKSHLRKGVMRTNKKGFGFVEVDGMDDDIFVAAENMNGAIHDDLVLVEITSKMNLDRLEGRILKIIN